MIVLFRLRIVSWYGLKMGGDAKRDKQQTAGREIRQGH